MEMEAKYIKTVSSKCSLNKKARKYRDRPPIILKILVKLLNTLIVFLNSILLFYLVTYC